MGTIPTCHRLVTALTDETAYGTAIADASLINMFHLVNPDVAEVSKEIINDQDMIKGHEFLVDTDAYKILFQDARITFTGIPMSAEFMGWLIASAMGNITSTQIMTSGDYDHVGKIQDKCTSDQLPSRTFGVLWAGSSAVNRRYKGACVDSFTIRINDKGRVTGDVTFIMDGSEDSGSAIAVPASFHSTSFWYGLDVDLLYANFGVGLVSNKTKFRGLELTYNNNLLVDEAKTKTFATQTTLPELRIGDRTIEIALTIEGDETASEYADALSTQRKVVRVSVTGVTLTGGNPANLVIDIPQAIWELASKGNDGTRRIFTMNHSLFHDATEATPLKITTTTRDTAYQ